MKNIKKYFGLTLIALLFSVFFSACKDEDKIDSDNIGLGIKVFTPTKVVPGQPVTINGSGFGDVKEVVFPGGIAVSTIERISNEMIRVVTPQGINIAAEGEKLIVRTGSEEAESPRLMTQGNTQPSTFSIEAGNEVQAKSIITVYGKDMEFVNKATFISKEDTLINLEAKDFYRIATNSVSIKIPANIKEGLQVGTFETMDGKQFNLPEYNYTAPAGGYFETVKIIIWENKGSLGEISWSSDYRFSNEQAATGEECYAIPMDQWEIIKNSEFKVDIEGANPQIRVTTGWWSTTWTGADIQPGNEHLEGTGDGTWTLSVNLDGDPILDLIDAQHLLFTGSGYSVQCIYTETVVWVEGDQGHWERKSLWKNEGALGDISWSSDYRFANEQNATGEECYTFSMEDWEFLKNNEFKVEVEGANPQIRVTSGWWSTTWTSVDIQPGNELLTDNEDGTWTLNVNLAGDPLLDVIDAQHLLFTGSGYKVNEIYVDVWVEGGSGGPKEVVIWENDGTHGAISWSSDYRFSNEQTSTGEEIFAIPMDQWDVIRTGTFYLDLQGDAPQIRVTTGWWSTTWTGVDIQPGNELLTDNEDGTWTLEINLAGDPILDVLDAQHLLFTGGGYTPLKLYYK